MSIGHRSAQFLLSIVSGSLLALYTAGPGSAFTITNGPSDALGCEQTSSGTYCGGGGDDGSGYSAPRIYRPSPQEIEQQRRAAAQAARQREAVRLNDKGVACYDAGDLDCAISYYEQSLRIWPTNTTRANFADVQARLALKNGDRKKAIAHWREALRYEPGVRSRRASLAAQEAWLEHDAGNIDAAIAKMREALKFATDKKFAEGIIRKWQEENIETKREAQEHKKTELEVNTALNAMQGNGPPIALQFATQNGEQRQRAEPGDGCIFNTGCTGQGAPAIVSTDKPLPSIDTKSDIQRLSSAANSSREAAKQNNPVLARGEAGCQFSGPGCKEPETVAVPKIDGRTPAAMKLLAHIPPPAIEAVNKDPNLKARIEKNIAWYGKREEDKAAKQTMLGDVQKRIDGRNGDMNILTAQKLQLQDELTRIDNDQKMAEDDIKHALVDRGLQWDESPPQSVGSAKP